MSYNYRGLWTCRNDAADSGVPDGWTLRDGTAAQWSVADVGTHRRIIQFSNPRHDPCGVPYHIQNQFPVDFNSGWISFSLNCDEQCSWTQVLECYVSFLDEDGTVVLELSMYYLYDSDYLKFRNSKSGGVDIIRTFGFEEDDFWVSFKGEITYNSSTGQYGWASTYLKKDSEGSWTSYGSFTGFTSPNKKKIRYIVLGNGYWNRYALFRYDSFAVSSLENPSYKYECAQDDPITEEKIIANNVLGTKVAKINGVSVANIKKIHEVNSI